MFDRAEHSHLAASLLSFNITRVQCPRRERVLSLLVKSSHRRDTPQANEYRASKQLSFWHVNSSCLRFVVIRASDLTWESAHSSTDANTTPCLRILSREIHFHHVLHKKTETDNLYCGTNGVDQAAHKPKVLGL